MKKKALVTLMMLVFSLAFFKPISAKAETVNESIILSPILDEDASGLQFKYVWMKDGWNEWGVIRDFSENRDLTWTPLSSGNYTIYIDVKYKNGQIITQKKDYRIQPRIWSFDGISSSADPAYERKSVTLHANTSGNTAGLKYKYVWMKDDWNEWSVIQDFSEKNIAEWIPPQQGEYKLYVDVLEVDGTITTYIRTYNVLNAIWNYEGIKIDQVESKRVYSPVTINAITSGDDNDLTYKYVWMKNNWNEWGIIRDFSSDKSIQWTPKIAGTYKIYVDIKDGDNCTLTKIKEIQVNADDWTLDSVSTTGNGYFSLGSTACLTANVSGNKSGLKYKYVWMKDNWSKWGVIGSGMSQLETAEFTFPEVGEYSIYVDVMDQNNVIRDPYIMHIWCYDYQSAGSSKQIGALGNRVLLYPNAMGPSGGVLFKYVWMKDNWNEWGVIKDFSYSSSVEWVPPNLGDYTIYIDSQDEQGFKKTCTRSIKITDSYLAMLEEIKQYTHVPYVWGGTSTNGWDCSGFTKWALSQMGVTIPRIAADQALQGMSISIFDRTQWQPGDVLAYSSGGEVDHVVLYLGNNQIMHAINSKYGTRIMDIDYYHWWDSKEKLVAVRRYLDY